MCVDNAKSYSPTRIRYTQITYEPTSKIQQEHLSDMSTRNVCFTDTTRQDSKRTFDGTFFY